MTPTVGTYAGCVDSFEAQDLDKFFNERVGPVIGWDYQHVYPIGENRWLWLFQDIFVDYPGTADNLHDAAFMHNIAMIQAGDCFTLYHNGSTTRPTSFEPGTGDTLIQHWWWPLGGETHGDLIYVFWAEIKKDGTNPPASDGLPWHPVGLWLATYSVEDLDRKSFEMIFSNDITAPSQPLYGYAVVSDDTHTYLFGNTYQQNLTYTGGFWGGPHTATSMWLARVPKGDFTERWTYWTGTDWSSDSGAAQPFQTRFWTENPMQPMLMNGQWIATTKKDGFWGEELVVDRAKDPWGPWETTHQGLVADQPIDPIQNNYHAHPIPWRTEGGELIVSISKNARDMIHDAFPHPERYRLMFFTVPFPQDALTSNLPPKAKVGVPKPVVDVSQPMPSFDPIAGKFGLYPIYGTDLAPGTSKPDLELHMRDPVGKNPHARFITYMQSVMYHKADQKNVNGGRNINRFMSGVFNHNTVKAMRNVQSFFREHGEDPGGAIAFEQWCGFCGPATWKIIDYLAST